MAIGTAAIGGAAIGGAAAGAAGFLRRVGKIADDYPDDMGAQGSRRAVDKLAADMEANPDRHLIDADLDADVRYFSAKTNDEILEEIELLKASDDPDSQMLVDAAEADLSSRKGRWSKTVQAETDAEIELERARLTADTSERLSRGDRKKLKAEIKELEYRLGRVTEGDIEVISDKGKSARKAKTEARERVRAAAEVERGDIRVQIDAINRRLESAKAGSLAEADLTRLEQGRYSKRLQESIDALRHKRLVDVDIDYARKLEKTRLAQSEQLPTPETYDVVPGETPRKVEDFEADDLAKYEARGEDGVVYAGGEVVSARNYIDERTAELDGLDSVRVCAIG